MNKIYINVDGMVKLKNKLNYISEDIRSLEKEIVNSLQHLDLEVSNRKAINDQISLARNRASIIADKSRRMGSLISRTLNEFTSTDYSCAKKQKELTGLLERFLLSFLIVTSKKYQQITQLGLRIIAAFEKAEIIFLKEPNQIKIVNINMFKILSGFATVGNGAILHQNVSNTIKERIKKVQTNKVVSPKKPQIPDFVGVLSYNSKKYNKEVAKIQKRLKELGYKGKDGKSLEEDGYFGLNTLNAVNLFKKRNKILNDGKNYGKINEKAWTTMFLSTALGLQISDKVPTKNRIKHPKKDKIENKSTVKTTERNNKKDSKRGPVKVSFGGAKISQYSADVLSNILKDAGLKKVRITSTTRSPYDQARIMYENLRIKGSSYSYELYASAGDKVINIYERLRGTKSKSEIIKAMEKKIIELGPSRVSKHCGDSSKLEVIDISPRSVSNKKAFEEGINKAIREGKVSKFIKPPKDPAYHIEIPQ